MYILIYNKVLLSKKKNDNYFKYQRVEMIVVVARWNMLKYERRVSLGGFELFKQTQ
jgi:hypothetical protein